MYKRQIFTFRDTDRDKGRVITGSSNLTQSGLLENLEFNVDVYKRQKYTEDQIISLSWNEHVRMRPGMYLSLIHI